MLTELEKSGFIDQIYAGTSKSKATEEKSAQPQFSRNTRGQSRNSHQVFKGQLPQPRKIKSALLAGFPLMGETEEYLPVSSLKFV